MMMKSNETYFCFFFIPVEAGCYVYPVSRVTKCIRRHPPSSARACASLSFDCFNGNRAEGSSTLESRPRFDLFRFLFSFKKKKKNATLLKASNFFPFCSQVFLFEPFSWYLIMSVLYREITMKKKEKLCLLE